MIRYDKDNMECIHIVKHTRIASENDGMHYFKNNNPTRRFLRWFVCTTLGSGKKHIIVNILISRCTHFGPFTCWPLGIARLDVALFLNFRFVPMTHVMPYLKHTIEQRSVIKCYKDKLYYNWITELNQIISFANTTHFE